MKRIKLNKEKSAKIIKEALLKMQNQSNESSVDVCVDVSLGLLGEKVHKKVLYTVYGWSIDEAWRYEGEVKDFIDHAVEDILRHIEKSVRVELNPYKSIDIKFV